MTGRHCSIGPLPRGSAFFGKSARSLSLDFGWRLVQAGMLEHLGEVAHVDHVSIDRTLDGVLGFIGRRRSIGASRTLRRRRDLGEDHDAPIPARARRCI